MDGDVDGRFGVRRLVAALDWTADVVITFKNWTEALSYVHHRRLSVV